MKRRRTTTRRTAALASLALAAVAGTIAYASHRQDDISTHRRLSLLDEDEALPGLFPFRWPQDYLGFGCATLGLLLAAGGGIGGGGILVPIYILLLEFPVKHAIPLASTTVLGGAVANNLLNARKVHPDHPERPAIDWDLILQLEPATIAGALIGADLNKELPELVLLVLMLLLLSVTAHKTLGKAVKLYKEEEKEIALRSNEGVVNEDSPLVDKEHLETDVEGANSMQRAETGVDDTRRHEIFLKCLVDATKLVGLFAVVTLIDLLEGSPDSSGGGPMGLQSCGAVCYWISEGCIFLIIILFSLHVRSSILERQASGGTVTSEIQWDERNTLLYPTMAIVAGLVAGMFGIGGGIVKGPLMLALGVHPKVASATSACMILFTSSTSTLSYLIFGYLKLDYAWFCLLLGFVATLVGQTTMHALLDRSGQRNSYIAFCIGGVVAISAVAMGIESVMAIIRIMDPQTVEEEAEQRPTSAAHLRKYRGGFTTSICDLFRDPHRRTDCCAVACCGVLSSDRSRFLLTGERPPPLWVRVLMYLIIPALFIAAMNYFAVDVPVDSSDDPNEQPDGEEQTQKVAPPGLLLAFIVYIVAIVAYGFMKNRRTRREIMTKLYEERARDRGEEVDPVRLQRFLSHHSLDINRAHGCWSFCYNHDYDFVDESTGLIEAREEQEEEQDEDFCTRLWDCLRNMFWCCGCWCQCFGCCALAQEEREVSRLTGNEQPTHDYMTFQPFNEYYPSIKDLQTEQTKNPLKHWRAISDLSGKLLKNMAAVLVILLLFALSAVDSAFTWENMIVLLLTLGQAFFIEYLVHWRWNLFDLSFDSVVKYFASGFLLATPMAMVFEIIVSTLCSAIVLVTATIVIAADSELANELAKDPKEGMKQLVVDYPGVYIFAQFLNAFFVAALVEEMLKYFSYRMVVVPDLLPGTSANRTDEEAVTNNQKTTKSTGAGITVAMVSVALGFACCENLAYVFVYSPPSLGIEISTLLARSLFPVHPLCAAIQSIGVCKRDLEGDKRFGLGRIIFPAILLHGSFDFVLMVAAFLQQRKDIIEGKDDESGQKSDDSEDSADLSEQLPALIIGLIFVITGYAYYVKQSRAQNRRLIAMDDAARDQSSPLV
ncbi:hypothetical protein ACHAXT_004412 [Thalassiosira profunda]